MSSFKRILSYSVMMVSSLSLIGCGISERLKTVGEPPPLTSIENPKEHKNYKPISTPLPPPVAYQPPTANSLWQTGARSFFKDQRANKEGDVITVLISIQDKGRLNNKTTRERNSQFKVNTPGLFGYNLNKLFPKEISQDTPFNITSAPTHMGEGDVDRREEIDLKIAALVTQVLPNGNLVIQGRQEIRVNYEVREVLVSGIIRKEDVLSSNTIRYEKIAEARISYGGRGQLSDVQQPPYGQQVIDAVWPF